MTGSVTLKSMRGMAEAMNCRFVYPVLPEQAVDELIKKQAIQKAKEQVKAASTHMAEAQALRSRLLQLN